MLHSFKEIEQWAKMMDYYGTSGNELGLVVPFKYHIQNVKCNTNQF